MSAPGLDPAVFRQRRAALAATVGGPVLLMGNGLQPRNLPLNHLPFRQDSTFLHFTGCAMPGAAALLDGDRCELFLPLPAPDDGLWHGELEGPDALKARYGVTGVQAAEGLAGACAGRALLSMAVSDPRATARLAALTGRSWIWGDTHGDEALVDAVIRLRLTRDAADVSAHRESARISTLAHRAAMAATHPGGHEQQIAALFDAVVASQGCVTAYDSIVTVRGEILHNPHHDNPLSAGDLLLLDGGAELPSGHCTDVTRTWPVSGTFSGRQRSAYEAVLAAQEAAIARCVPGVRYRDVHLESARVLTRWLVDEGLVRGNVDDAVAAGAHAIFYPHGCGHLLGLDVHDLEQFGDRAAYGPGAARSEQFGLCYLRLDLPLVPGLLVTVEPGFYVAPAILDDPGLRSKLGEWVDFDAAQDWVGFGGIRIEDDVLVTDGEVDVLTAAIPKTVSDVEALVGSGPTPAARLGL
jgi:Xaa-Pro aminopeptidase